MVIFQKPNQVQFNRIFIYPLIKIPYRSSSIKSIFLILVVNNSCVNIPITMAKK